MHFFPGVGAQRDEIEGGNEAGIAFIVEEMDEVHVGGVVKGGGDKARAVINENHGSRNLRGDFRMAGPLGPELVTTGKIQAMARKIGAAVIACLMGQVGEHDDIGGFSDVVERLHRAINGLHVQGAFGEELHHGFFAFFGAERGQALPAGGYCC